MSDRPPPDPRAGAGRSWRARPGAQRLIHRLVAVRAQARAISRVGIDGRRGLRYGKRMPSSRPGGGTAPPPGRLESYFDAWSDGPGIWKWRHYFPIYEQHLGRFVGRAPCIVEIGIFSGGSLRMWLDYFGEGTRVYGVDIEPACKAHEGPSVRVSIGDQGDPEFWTRFLADVPHIDIVIDDGAHAAAQQVPTLEALLPRIRPGGVYLCEDIHGRHHGFHAYLDGLSRNLNAVGTGSPEQGYEVTPFQRAIASVHRYPFVAVIEKRSVDVARLIAPRHGTEWEPSFYGSQRFPSEAAPPS